MDFFEQSNAHITELNENERKIFEYVVRHIHKIQEMQIRVLATNCYVSTTTIIRFTKKLGFDGYRDFTRSIIATCQSLGQTELPSVLWNRSYSEEYLKNIIESVRVISQEKLDRFKSCMEKHPRMYFFGTGLDKEAAHYAYHLFLSMGYHACCPTEEYEVKSAISRFEDGDILFLCSLSGDDTEVIQLVENARLRCTPVVVTVTQSANNLLQSISDLDFYVFTDQVRYKGINLSSRISMISIAELLAYSLISKET